MFDLAIAFFALLYAILVFFIGKYGLAALAIGVCLLYSAKTFLPQLR